MKLQYLLMLVVFLACVSALCAAASLYFVSMQSQRQMDLLQRIEALEKEAAKRPSSPTASEKVQRASVDVSLVQSVISDLRQQEAVLAEHINRLSQAIHDVPQPVPAN